VSMGFTAAMRTRRSVLTLRMVLATELVAAAQALELRAPLRPGAATAALLGSLRESIPHLDDDRVLAGDLALAVEWLRQRCWRTALPGVTDVLE
jgi:histidine ammonia-lyase